MQSRARQRSIATSIRRSRGVRRTGATLISAMILASAAGLASPARKGQTGPKASRHLRQGESRTPNATKPKASPLDGLMPAAGNPLDESISPASVRPQGSSCPAGKAPKD